MRPNLRLSQDEALDGSKPITVITFTWCDHHINVDGGGGVNSRSDINPRDTGWCDLSNRIKPMPIIWSFRC